MSPAGDDVRLDVRVSPRARRDGVLGWRDGRLAVSVRAAPADGAANASVVELLATVLGVPRRAVTLERGLRGRTKTVRVTGLDRAGLAERLERIAPRAVP